MTEGAGVCQPEVSTAVICTGLLSSVDCRARGASWSGVNSTALKAGDADLSPESVLPTHLTFPQLQSCYFENKRGKDIIESTLGIHGGAFPGPPGEANPRCNGWS